MVHLGVKLYRVNFLGRIFHGGDGILGPSDGPKSLWEGSHVIAVAVPHPQGRGNPREEL